MERNKVATVIFGYAGAKHIIDRHLELWKKYSDILIFSMPEDDCCEVPGHLVLRHDKSIKYGWGIIRRTMYTFKKALELNADIFCLMEYDAVMLKRPVISEDRQIQANVFYSDPNFIFEGHRFEGKFFCHYPHIFTRKALEHLCSVMDETPFELGFQDRWLGAQLEKHNIPVFNLLTSGEGFSQNTIETPEPLIKALSEGRYAIHGIKSDEVYNVIK